MLTRDARMCTESSDVARFCKRLGIFPKSWSHSFGESAIGAYKDPYGILQNGPSIWRRSRNNAVLRLSIRRCIESCMGMIKDNEGVENLHSQVAPSSRCSSKFSHLL